MSFFFPKISGSVAGPGNKVHLPAFSFIYQYNVSPAFDISTASFDASFSHSCRGLAWNNDGTKFHTVHDSETKVNEFIVSTAFDVSTASANGSLDVSSNINSPFALAWNNDGTKLYISDYDSDNIVSAICEYSVSTAFDVSTASFTDKLDSTLGHYGISWNNDGTKLYIASNNDDSIHEYSVSTAFDVSTATKNDSLDLSGDTNALYGMSWNNDGTKLYACWGPDTVGEYSVSTAFDVSTASFTDSYSDGFDIYDVTWS